MTKNQLYSSLYSKIDKNAKYIKMKMMERVMVFTAGNCLME